MASMHPCNIIPTHLFFPSSLFTPGRRRKKSGGKVREYIAQELPLFKSIEKKHQFVEEMGALSLRLK
jgi:hypothetical protein